MVLCAAYGCNNRTDRNLRDKRIFYTIPNAKIHPEKRNLAAQWLHNIGTGWSVKNFNFASYKRVCEDHFEASCFMDDMEARLMGYQKKKKKLKRDAVPTVFAFKQHLVDDSRAKRAEKRTQKQVSYICLNSKESFQYV